MSARWFQLHRLDAQAKAKTGYAAEVELYSDIGMFGVTASDFAAALNGIEGRILVRIASLGGSVNDGIAIYNRLRAHKGGVDTVVDSWAASIASVIMLAGEKRTLGTGGMVMVHRAWTLAFGDANDLRETADNLEKIEGSIRAIYAERTGATPETIDGWLDGKDHWLDASQAFDAGFATETAADLKAVASVSADQLRKYFPAAPAAVLARLNPSPAPMTEPAEINSLAQALERIEGMNATITDLQAKAARVDAVDGALRSLGIDPTGKDASALAAAVKDTAKRLGASQAQQIAASLGMDPLPVSGTEPGTPAAQERPRDVFRRQLKNLNQ
jgi:ATP-dependent protease ClpP protease subunit